MSMASQESRVRRGSLCSVGSLASCISIMQRVEEKLSSAATDSGSLRPEGRELQPGGSRLVRRPQPAGPPPRPGALSLRALVALALVGTAALSCGTLLCVLEAAAPAGQPGPPPQRGAAVAASCCCILASLLGGLLLGGRLAAPLGGAVCLAELLAEPDAARRAAELGRLRAAAGRSWIRDVGELQDACHRLARGVEMFMRYVPDTVVRSIVRGDENATRLHVFRRKVTIMFSDIKDFTAISESLSQEDLLYVLTRYLSIMTKVVESYQGVVAEILGDGLLVFWNTPDDVPTHELKACAAAMAQQQVLAPLNAELARLKLPAISVRIGLHTGRVLSGTIGSETKMKFGCLGDPVNLASRLEGLCKVYGVGVICSGETRDGLPTDSGFVCRQLDLVQVKGKRTATRIYEVVGVANCEACLEEVGEGRGVKSAARTAMKESTHALRESDVLQVNHIHSQRGSFFRLGSYNLEELAEASAPRDGQPESSGGGTMGRSATLHSLNSLNSASSLWDAVTPEACRHVELYERALREYQQANFGEARALLGVFLEQLPEDRAAALLLERTKRYAPESGEAVGLDAAALGAWTGVTVINEK